MIFQCKLLEIKNLLVTKKNYGNTFEYKIIEI